jgi:hypothetical protein
MFRVWCEYDYGQDSYVFSSEENAISWINSILEADLGHFEADTSVEDLWNDGLVSIALLEVDPTP